MNKPPRRHMRDLGPATTPEEQEFARRWGIYAQQHVDEPPRGPNQELLDESRWGDSRTVQFVFAGAGTQSKTTEQIIDVTAPARVWSVHLAATALTQALPAGDSFVAFFTVFAGVGSSTIRLFREILSGSMIVNPFDPQSQLTADLIVSDVPARKILVAGLVTYTAVAGAVTMNVRLDAAVSPVMR